MFRKLLVGLDGSENARKALTVAVGLAGSCEADVTIVSVEELPRYPATVGEVDEVKEALDEQFQGTMREALRLAAEAEVSLAPEIRVGHPAKQILEAARELEVDLIVPGAGGHNLIRDFLLGTTTDRLSHHAACSVLVVR
jgi:nucleotide-binding universal stress UspA family protein